MKTGSVVIALAASAWLTGTTTSQPSASPGAAPLLRPAVADHSYRVVGRARLIFFTVSADDVGGARLTWKRSGDRESVRLLAGSEPERAPRDLNEWGYTSEDSVGDRSDTFVVRSLNAVDFMGQPSQKATPRGNNTTRQFRAVCTSTAGATVQSYTTTVKTEQEITYHALGNLLDSLSGTPAWQPRDFARPTGAAPGFLTALARLIGASVDAYAAHAPQPTSMAYIYNATVYDLQLRKVRELHNVNVAGRTYPEALRADFVAVRRSDGDPSAFNVTYPTNGDCAGVPIVIGFRASWWLTIELQLDDHYEVPPDPGGDASVASRIREICAPARAVRSQ